MKKKRQDTILSLIAAEEIPTQEVLRERMEEHGFAVTQATLSRDIRELKLTKERRGSGRACYTAPVRQEVNGGILQNAALRTDFAGKVAGNHRRTRHGTGSGGGVRCHASGRCGGNHCRR